MRDLEYRAKECDFYSVIAPRTSLKELEQKRDRLL